MRIGVIADIHGNAPALEVVLDDLARQGVDSLIHLGDAFNGPIDPVGVAELLQARPMIHIRGNGERMVLAEDPAQRSRSANYARDRLNREHLAWIGGWPAIYQNHPVFACHGSPASDMEYLLEEITAAGVRSGTPSEIQARLGGVQAGLVLCAHSHVPRVVRVRSTCVLNPGSVGLPAYALEVPFPHRMEVGSPCARYAIAEGLESQWRVSHLAVPYDHEQAAATAEQAGFPEWAVALKTGYAS